MHRLYHLIFSILYFLILCFLLMHPVNFILASFLLFLILLIWKLFSGLAWHNFFILFGSFLILKGLTWTINGNLIVLLGFLITVLFYLQAIKWKEIPHWYDIIRNLFFGLHLFLFLLLCYTLFYKLHYSWHLISLLLIFGIIIFVYWKILIDKTAYTFQETLMFYLLYLEIVFLFFSLSNGFFIYPVLSSFWFFILLDLIESLKGKNLANKFSAKRFLITITITLILILGTKL